MISDYEIDMVLKLAGHHFDQTKGFRSPLRKQYFLEALGRGLHNKQAGTMRGVCHRCLGTGYEPARDNKKKSQEILVGSN